MDRTFCIAPMMGRTDTHFRNLCRFASKHAVLFTEMVHSNALLKNKRIDKYIQKTDIENPVVFQLGGCEPKDLAEATKIINENKYDEINLNVGCPSPRVKSGGFGAFLMYEPTKVKDCLSAMSASSDIPITAKIRLGVDDQDIEETLDNFIEIILQSGIKTLYVHARKGMLEGLNPKENRNIPPLNYERVYRLKEDFPDIEIILNGGLSNFLEDKNKLLEEQQRKIEKAELLEKTFPLAELEEKFDISIKTEDLIQFESFTQGVQILARYKVTVELN